MGKVESSGAVLSDSARDDSKEEEVTIEQCGAAVQGPPMFLSETFEYL